MSGGNYHVLFLSRRSSARSIMAEAILNKKGNGRFLASSAAVEPAEAVDEHVIELLRASELPIATVRPKHYSAFAEEGAAKLDFVFTLCDRAAGEPLPLWPGQPVTAHWSASDPTLAEGEEWQKKLAFAKLLVELERRLSIFISLPFASLDELSLQRRLREIGQRERRMAS